eukprot:CAMPEP_0172210700 /NCGR_PEP_ID=MMETSP1050-20130122/35932_1 /TAXON_ID=233186 /ORGANISM="Cryptomonas curvata, Strain CCAP979/52" /LENGTH=74 /DNA_ID=CAMNT_0012890949 /DNA_START=27 /DNA_END=248 /DNA_ORIENTATION=+
MSEIAILDPLYPELGMRKFLYDSLTKRWSDSMDNNRQIRFRVTEPAGGPAREDAQVVHVRYADASESAAAAAAA